MLFNSYEFLAVFLPLSLLAFHGARWIGWSGALTSILLTLSIIFYTRPLSQFWWILFLSIGWNYAIAICIRRFLRNNEHRNAKWTMRLGVIGDLAVLGYFKYALFVGGLLGIFTSTTAAVVIPLGISFYTFTQIAFLIDLNRGEVKEFRLLTYSLFVTYFPHLIAGPIIHHKEMIPQFEQLGRISPAPDNMAKGTILFVIGLFKKTVIADSLAPAVGVVFDGSHSGISFADCWLGALSYTMQIYFDFSAYSDMALGISLMFGITLPINFFSPYKATSIIEFWRRWHISLSNFLRDYVYFSLGGNRVGRPRKYLNIFLTMLIGGIWHGSGFTFIVWGGLHGILILANHVWRDFFKDRLSLKSRALFVQKIARLFCWGTTFFVVVVAWVFFRAPNINSALNIASGMLTWPTVQSSAGGTADWTIVVAACAMAWLAPNAYEILEWRPLGRLAFNIEGAPFFQRRSSFAYSVSFGIVFAVAVLFIQRRSVFLYWQF